MPDSEEKKPVLEEDPSSVAEKSVPSSEHSDHSLQSGPTEDPVLEVPPTAVSSQEKTSQLVSLPKVELKKHATAVAAAHAAIPSASAARGTQPVSTPLKKEVNANLPAGVMEVEIDFILDRKSIPLTALSTLAVGEMITLSGTDFKVTLFLQEKAIGEGELVMVDQKPTIQVTKIFNLS